MEYFEPCSWSGSLGAVHINDQYTDVVCCRSSFDAVDLSLCGCDTLRTSPGGLQRFCRRWLLQLI